MKVIKFLLVVFITLTSLVKADSVNEISQKLKKEGYLIFIRHAYAPGGGDPNTFNLDDCSTQRNLSNSGRIQAKKIGSFFKNNFIPIDLVISSEWCRCKETALISFKNFITKNFLNSFYSKKFASNKDQQMKDLKDYIKNWDGKKNLVFITHYVVIAEILNYAPSSGEIVISDKNLKVIETINIGY
jgi:phosphohistidine phosphatase SixA